MAEGVSLQEHFVTWLRPLHQEWAALYGEDLDLVIRTLEPMCSEATYQAGGATSSTARAPVDQAAIEAIGAQGTLEELQAALRHLASEADASMSASSVAQRCLPAAVLAAPRPEALRGMYAVLAEAVMALQRRRSEQRIEEQGLEEDLVSLRGLDGPCGETVRRLGERIQRLQAELRQAGRDRAACIRELARRDAIRSRRELQLEQRSVLQRRARAVRPPAAQASGGYAPASAASTAPVPVAATAPAAPGGAAAPTSPALVGAAAPAAAMAAASSEDGRAAATGVHRSRRARRGDDEPFTGVASSTQSSEPQSMVALAAPGTRWRCSICGLLIDDQTRARRHCATAHGSQPCEPLEVPSTAGSSNSRPSLPASSTSAAGGGSTLVAGPSMATASAPPTYTASSIMPPVAPIFSATRDLVTSQALRQPGSDLSTRLAMPEAPEDMKEISDADI